MSKTINERIITVSKAYITTDQDFKLGDELQLTVIGDVIEISERDNQDGSINRVYKVKGITAHGKSRQAQNNDERLSKGLEKVNFRFDE